VPRRGRGRHCTGLTSPRHFGRLTLDIRRPSEAPCDKPARASPGPVAASAACPVRNDNENPHIEEVDQHVAPFLPQQHVEPIAGFLRFSHRQPGATLISVKVAVIGGGVVGAAAAFELAKMDVSVVCYEPHEPFSARSIGGTRIFRLAHTDPRLVDLASHAKRKWAQWSEEAGQLLVRSEGLVISGATGEWEEAMREAGLRPAVGALPEGRQLPFEAGRQVFLHDADAGVIDAFSTRDFLLSRITVVPEAVRNLEPTAAGVRVQSTSGFNLYDAVVVAAGAGTPELAKSAGVAVPSLRFRHTRFTYRLQEPLVDTPCWIDRSEDWREGFTSYSHTVGRGLWAIGGSLPDDDTRWELGAEEVARRSRELMSAFVRERLPRVIPDIVEEISCDFLPVPLGDGFVIERQDGITYIWGQNLFKFAPLLGRMLGEIALGKAAPIDIS
jgi:sarcosine oxidase